MSNRNLSPLYEKQKTEAFNKNQHNDYAIIIQFTESAFNNAC